MNGRAFSDAELKLLIDLYPTRPTAEIAKALKRPVWSLYRRARILGLKKSPEFLASDESGRLKKGQTRPRMELEKAMRRFLPASDAGLSV